MRYDTQREVMYAFLMKKDGIAGGGLVSTGGIIYYFPRDSEAVRLAMWYSSIKPHGKPDHRFVFMDRVSGDKAYIQLEELQDDWSIGTITAWHDLKRLVPVFEDGGGGADHDGDDFGTVPDFTYTKVDAGGGEPGAGGRAGEPVRAGDPVEPIL